MFLPIDESLTLLSVQTVFLAGDLLSACPGVRCRGAQMLFPARGYSQSIYKASLLL